ncbi:capsular biosynthesis protein [Helicobacter sp. MIT 21-1697]|uniref:capsular biosynthesis protein n=1 Tax=Helicobacter sp. MIT 21-1697 TaxID=2993733 RepID=UPI00224A9933|nr:capsular biosynthesis protein [Helicobacter sp. MIT 21-1697]MCX2716957.1 capsular biosynthesis protein [Helicobacter sp. MIT 21-1697]
MHSITLLCDHNITQKPRSSRMLQLLDIIRQEGAKLNLNVIAKACDKSAFEALGIESRLLCFERDKSSKERTQQENELILQYCQSGNFAPLIYTSNRKSIPHLLESLPPQDVLIVEDITLLPFAREYKKNNPQCKILIDLREFYPLEYENDEVWLQGLGRFFVYLCEQYLPCVDVAISVSEGLCERYKSDFGIDCELFYSLPPFFDYKPKPTSKQEIKILYHGFISPDRSSMELLNLAQHLLESPYKLYVMALSNQKGFLESFRIGSSEITSLEILPPVALGEIIPVSANYDIGLIPFKPTTFNLAHCMPNKLFEYLQARLAILSTPLYDVQKFVQTHSCGAITQGFESDDMAQMLFKLHITDIDRYKQESHRAAQKWHLDFNVKCLKNLLYKLNIKVE